MRACLLISTHIQNLRCVRAYALYHTAIRADSRVVKGKKIVPSGCVLVDFRPRRRQAKKADVTGGDKSEDAGGRLILTGHNILKVLMIYTYTPCVYTI
jgi:hypothetical protein